MEPHMGLQYFSLFLYVYNYYVQMVWEVSRIVTVNNNPRFGHSHVSTIISGQVNYQNAYLF